MSPNITEIALQYLDLSDFSVGNYSDKINLHKNNKKKQKFKRYLTLF